MHGVVQEGWAPIAGIGVARSLAEADLLDGLVELVGAAPKDRRHAVELLVGINDVLGKTHAVRRDNDQVDVEHHAEPSGFAVVRLRKEMLLRARLDRVLERLDDWSRRTRDLLRCGGGNRSRSSALPGRWSRRRSRGGTAARHRRSVSDKISTGAGNLIFNRAFRCHF